MLRQVQEFLATRLPVPEKSESYVEDENCAEITLAFPPSVKHCGD